MFSLSSVVKSMFKSCNIIKKCQIFIDYFQGEVVHFFAMVLLSKE
jgi:hypothetical protein